MPAVWAIGTIGSRAADITSRGRGAVPDGRLAEVFITGTKAGSAAETNAQDAAIAMSMLMGGMCHLTAVWLLYRRPYDLVQRGEELFDRIELSFLAGGRSRGGRHKPTSCAKQ